jgi:membrane associated rhomboid family serine protease
MRRARFTYGMGALVIGVYVLAEIPGTSVLFLLLGCGPVPPGVALLALWPSAVLAGQYWRLLTATFLHAGLPHLLLNLLGLLLLGVTAEHRFGRTRLAALFFSAALAGNLAALVATPASLTLGASGAVMGVAGGLVTLMLRYRLEREALTWVAAGVVATLLNGILRTGISNAAHVGGFAAGFLLAWVIGADPGWVRREHRLEDATARAERRRVQEVLASSSRLAVRDDVLQDPANRLVLRGTSWRLMAVLVGGILFFSACSIAAIAVANGLLILLSALMIAVGLLAVFMSLHARLTLTPAGLAYRSVGWESFTCGWADVDRFEPYAIATGAGSQHRVRCRFVRRQQEGPRLVQRDIRAVGGMNGVALATLLEDWRLRWTGPDETGTAGTRA